MSAGRSVLALALLLSAGCATLRQIVALRTVDFALGPIDQVRLAGVDLARVRGFSDLTPLDAGRIAAALARKEIPLEFTLGLEATNPAENKVTARMVRFQWGLYLQDKETIHGAVDSAVVLPPGVLKTIPLEMRLDLLEFFQGSAQDLVNLALGLMGRGGTPTKVSLRAQPTIDTPIGPIEYPSPITIVSRTVGR
jgi:hypothetical protein